MNKRMYLKLAAAALATWLASGLAFAQTTIDVQYPLGFIFDKTMQEVKTEFEKRNPSVRVNFRPAYKEYEDAAQTALRDSITKNLPDVSFQAINLQRLFVDRKIAVDLTPFIGRERNWAGEGFSDSMMALSRFGGNVHGLAFAASTPIVYFNEDLVRKAGGNPDAFPTTWDGIFELARKIDALGDNTVGMYHSWTITGNWMWQALVLSHGGTMLSADEKKVAFDGDGGKRAIQLMGRMLKEGKMPNLAHEAARQSFFAGKMGIWTESTSLLRVADDSVGGRFKWRTAVFPIPGPNAKLPTGGMAAMMFASAPEKQKAAWEFMKFATGAEGATMMVKGTGYMPPNSLPADNPAMLKPFYATRPNHLISLKQQPLMTAWYAFPGDNALKIIAVIKDHLQSVVDTSVQPEAALAAMAKDVQNLIPK
ncbi:MAG: ABC transporter substrate-binding protein [Betaproteobacteria bacterium]|nr:ABC transporter substrate-binding protein [Betaproteobacteria bacterium]